MATLAKVPEWITQWRKIDPLGVADISNVFTNVKDLGEGSYGVVKQAKLNNPIKELEKDATVAIKYLIDMSKSRKNPADEDDHKNHQQYVRNEIDILSLLSANCSQFVNKIHDILYNINSDTGYLVVEFLNGQDMKKALENYESIDDKDTIATQLTEGLLCLHSAGVAHRDIKPANIMLTYGRAVWIDFGFACLKDTCGPKSVGSPSYAAPERLLLDYDKSVHSWMVSDFWSFGCTLHMLAKGDKYPVQKRFNNFDIKTPETLSALTALITTKAAADATFEEVPPIIGALLPLLLTVNPVERETKCKKLNEVVKKFGFAAPLQESSYFFKNQINRLAK